MKNNTTPLPAHIRRNILEISLMLFSVAGLLLWPINVYKLHLWWLEFLLAVGVGLAIRFRPWLKRDAVGIIGIIIVVAAIIVGYLPSSSYFGYTILGIGSLWIGYASLELYRNVKNGRTLAKVWSDIGTIAYSNRLETRKPAHLPEGYVEVLTQKNKTDYEKDAVKLFFQIKGTESLITLTESNGPLGSALRFKARKILDIKGVRVAVNNPIDVLSSRRSKNMMDALWNYRGQSYQLFSNALTVSDVQGIINSLIN